MQRWNAIAGLLLLVTAGRADETAPLSFTRDIRPILSDFCYKCHGPDAGSREADLRLDTEEGAQAALALEDGVAKLLARVTSDDAHLMMPPPAAKKPLRPTQVELLKRWVAEGAPWGTHWAFEPLVAPAIPETPKKGGVAIHNPIDNFVQARLAASKIEPAPEAARETLIRRVSLDLTGLPPTPAEVDAFIGDTAEGAYERVLDRLLASPAYGERMAWNWLDAARYADSNGYQGDSERTQWPWRDWVIEAFNRNLPYDEFTVWQIAGDQLPEATTEQKLATAFCRNHMINGEGGRIAEENRVDYVMDMTETVGTVWLGLTMNCCRCHDHKFDPLAQRDYYRMLAFFNQTPVDGGGGDPHTPPAIDVRVHNASVKVMVMQDRPELRKTFMLSRGLYDKPGEEVAAGVPAKLPQLPDVVRANRLALGRWLVADENPLTARVTVNRIWQQYFGIGLVKTTDDFGVQGEIPVQLDLLDWLAADFRAHGWDVKRLVRQIVTSHTYRQSSRVAGQASRLPADHEKENHGQARRLSYEEDPDNRLLARGPRFRLPSPMIRDQALAASGLLVRHVGGPPVRGYQPSGVWEEATFGGKRYEQDHGEALYRRSLYTFWRRISAPTMFFDNASRQTCQVKELRTNTPLHALLTLNDVTFVEASRVLAERVLLTENLDDARRIDDIYRRLLARRASTVERHILLAALARAREEFRADVEFARKFVAIGESKRDDGIDPSEHAAWTSLTLAVMNVDESLTKE